MMRGLLDVEGGGAALHSYHRNICQRTMKGQSTGFRRVRGGEQGDAMMPLLFAVGHRALEATHRRMNPGEFLMAFHDDVYMATPPARVGPMHAVVQEDLFVHACIRVHHGKTKVWNQAGVRPVACNALERIARTNNPEAVVWTGSTIPTAQQGIKVLGTPIGHQDFVAAQLESVRREHEVLLSRIPSIRAHGCCLSTAPHHVRVTTSGP